MNQEPSNEPMGEIPPPSEIEDFLKDLQSADTKVRRHRIQALRGQNVADARIVEALKTLAAGDPAGSVRKDAKKTLKSMGIEPPPLSPEFAKKRRDFWTGVGIFFGLNFVLRIVSFALVAFLYSSGLAEEMVDIISVLVSLAPWIINIGLIIFFAFKRPQRALGMLAGFGMALLLVVCLFSLWIGYCFATGNI